MLTYFTLLFTYSSALKTILEAEAAGISIKAPTQVSVVIDSSQNASIWVNFGNFGGIYSTIIWNFGLA